MQNEGDQHRASEVSNFLKNIVPSVSVAMTKAGFQTFEMLWNRVEELRQEPALSVYFDGVTKNAVRKIVLGQDAAYEKISKTGTLEQPFKAATEALAMALERDPAALFGMPSQETPVFQQQEDPFDSCMREELCETVSAVVSHLSRREQDVIERRHGLITGHEETLQQISTDFRARGEVGPGMERIRAIEANALRKLKNPRYSGILREFAEWLNPIQGRSRLRFSESFAEASITPQDVEDFNHWRMSPEGMEKRNLIHYARTPLMS